MSGILSDVSLDAVSILTDGSVYRDDGTLIAIRRKIAVSDRLPLAVACRGNFFHGNTVSRKIIRLAEDVGFDRMLVDVEQMLPSFAGAGIEVLIAGISESAGPTHRLFLTKQMPGRPAPFTLIDPGPMHWGFGTDGRRGSDEGGKIGLKDFGIPAPSGEPRPAWLSRHGPAIFEYFRRIPVPIDPGDVNTDRQHLIGGHLDMTVVTPRSVSISLLHRWPDKVGEKIDPFQHQIREVA